VLQRCTIFCDLEARILVTATISIFETHKNAYKSGQHFYRYSHFRQQARFGWGGGDNGRHGNFSETGLHEQPALLG
jgi:hypothetical protein